MPPRKKVAFESIANTPMVKRPTSPDSPIKTTEIISPASSSSVVYSLRSVECGCDNHEWVQYTLKNLNEYDPHPFFTQKTRQSLTRFVKKHQHIFINNTPIYTGNDPLMIKLDLACIDAELACMQLYLNILEYAALPTYYAPRDMWNTKLAKENMMRGISSEFFA